LSILLYLFKTPKIVNLVVLYAFIIGFVINAIVNWRGAFRVKEKQREAGERFYSKFLAKYGTVVKYTDEENWWYKLDGSNEILKATEGTLKLKWIKKDI